MLRNPKAIVTARLTLGLYLATLAALVITTFYPAPVEGVSITLILTVKLLPLIGFVVPVYRGNNHAYILLAFVVIFYFTQGVISAWLSEGGTGAVITTLLTFLLFTVAMVHLKVNRSVAV